MGMIQNLNLCFLLLLLQFCTVRAFPSWLSCMKYPATTSTLQAHFKRVTYPFAAAGASSRREKPRTCFLIQCPNRTLQQLGLLGGPGKGCPDPPGTLHLWVCCSRAVELGEFFPIVCFLAEHFPFLASFPDTRGWSCHINDVKTFQHWNSGNPRVFVQWSLHNLKASVTSVRHPMFPKTDFFPLSKEKKVVSPLEWGNMVRCGFSLCRVLRWLMVGKGIFPTAKGDPDSAVDTCGLERILPDGDDKNVSIHFCVPRWVHPSLGIL
ncbi:hypothetical protein GWK47_011634 [Chionoecetes opilio]|uniref:Uncharacterized protein n=1 Tax=Chionoecetes opilio TaxID=41210 RepID=A0A8J4XZ05_CHIOP|nr:hypothetical protein GWK47_011634 [Chionoecetes opilio]